MDFNLVLEELVLSLSHYHGFCGISVSIMNMLIIDPYLPPDNVQLVGVSTAGLLFSWNQTQTCPSLRYNINQSENCGQCPNTTTDTSVNCSDFSLSNFINLCTFAVQAVICGNNGTPLFGNFSDFIIVNLTGNC